MPERFNSAKAARGVRRRHLTGGMGMSKLLRGGLAGLAAWKWGGGIIGTILVFLLVYFLLGVIF